MGENLYYQVQSLTTNRLVTIENPDEGHQERLWRKQRRDSGGRDSGIEPSPRVSRIPRRKRCCPNTAKQQTLNMETITRDVQISLRRYHLERKIFFQLMELKRLQIRHGKANEHVLIKRQVRLYDKGFSFLPLFRSLSLSFFLLLSSPLSHTHIAHQI